MRKNFLFILGVLFLAASVLGCNTMRGVGKDMEGGGKSIQKTVNHND